MPTAVANMAAQWYALQVKPRSESPVADILGLAGWEVFLPRVKERRRWSDRVKEVHQLLFPGYIFCRISPRDFHHALAARGVTGIVGYGATPAPVEEEEIAAIRALVASGLPMQSRTGLSRGDRIRLIAGPLCGLEGVLECDGQRARIVVGVGPLQRSVRVEIERRWIRPLGPAPVRRSEFYGSRLRARSAVPGGSW